MSARARIKKPILVTGGCGFIGCNIADALATRGDPVLILDNLSRPGANENAHWLKMRHGDRIEIRTGDIRDAEAVTSVASKSSAVLHLAAQVAVTTSLDSPLDDFETNARGTINVLESLRRHNADAPVIFASTNKVYGRLLSEDEVVRSGTRYAPTNPQLATGVRESTPLDFYSPYGCSKGCADQYVNDYGRVFGLRSAVLRMSCVFGQRQFGTEDQGWIAHFIIHAINNEPITIYGDGMQVRDALYVSDAVAAWLLALDQIDRVRGSFFNLGGGPENALSLLELLDIIAEMRGHHPLLRFADWRPGDQPWYVSSTAALAAATDWAPRVSLRDGLHLLHAWLEQRFAPGRREASL